MKNKKTVLMVVTLLMAAALAGAVYLASKSQETRKGAAFAGAALSVAVAKAEAIPINSNVDANILVKPEAGGLVDSVRTKLCFGAGLELVEPKVVVGPAFSSVLTVNASGKCVNLTVIAIKDNDQLLGNAGVSLVAAKVKLKAVAVGSGRIDLTKDACRLTGPNPDNTSQDMDLSVSSVAGIAYTIVAGAGPTATPPEATPTVPAEATSTPMPTPSEDSLSFKFSYLEVREDYAGADDWKLTVIVRQKDGTQTVAEKVATTKTEETVTYTRDDDRKVKLRVYQASVPLTGIADRKDLAVFIRGPKHIQVKYGVDGQTDFYNQAGGELTVVKGTVYDFSKYPALPGDVSGEARGVRDGKIDGRDFSFIKSEVVKRSQGDIKADLNGNQALESGDITTFAQALKERQSQLY